MGIRVALAGNPNCGKTTMFNALTGANQYVGNWPGVTVEKKEGACTRNKDVIITDLPGVYSLSPYSPEEIVTRDYLLEDGPDVVVNLVDATSLERNLYLTSQILDLGIPVVVALNMMDLANKRGDKIDVAGLSQQLGCPVVETTALKGQGMGALLDAASKAAKEGAPARPQMCFDSAVEDALNSIQPVLAGRVSPETMRWYAIKLFEGESKTIADLALSEADIGKVAGVRDAAEVAFDDDAESIITTERYDAITHVVDKTVKKSNQGLSPSQKIDRVVTNRWLGLPIFVVVMSLVYIIAVSTVGTLFTDWANDGVFGDGWLYTGTEQFDEATATWEETVAAAEKSGASEGELAILAEQEPDPSEYGIYLVGIPVVLGEFLTSIGTADWLQSLVLDGIIAGVGAVLGFVPQMIVLFLLLSLLEACGYMARVAFIMDRIFRKFGLSGKSFIPMLIASGCGVPAIMATKTIENEKDRRMTIMTTTMIPCGAKLPIIALVFGSLAGGDVATTLWIAPLFYFLGVIAIIVSGIMLKKTKMFAGETTPFVMELPQYHVPALKGVLLTTGERAKSFIVKAGTIIFLSSIVIWFLMNFGLVDGQFGLLDTEAEGYISYSLMAGLGNAISWIFAPLGFADWQATVTSITGLVAKENVVATVGILTNLGDAGEADASMWAAFGTMMGGSVSAILAFCAFNLLCAPCFAAIGTIRRQMESAKWTWFAIGYMTAFAWCVGLLLYQFGGLLTGELTFSGWTVVASVVAIGMLFQLVRPMPNYDKKQDHANKFEAEKCAS